MTDPATPPGTMVVSPPPVALEGLVWEVGPHNPLAHNHLGAEPAPAPAPLGVVPSFLERWGALIFIGLLVYFATKYHSEESLP